MPSLTMVPHIEVHSLLHDIRVNVITINDKISFFTGIYLDLFFKNSQFYWTCSFLLIIHL